MISIYSESMQKRMLSEGDFTLSCAVEPVQDGQQIYKAGHPSVLCILCVLFVRVTFLSFYFCLS